MCAFKESQWIGHSNQVRADHYLMIQDADYQEAARWGVAPAETDRIESELSIDRRKSEPERVEA